MKAAVLRQVGQPLSLEEVAIGLPGPREVLIRTAATGVCHSDLHFIEGSYPHPLPAVLGHEAAGVVEKVGSEVRTVQPGDHVITCLSAFCGHCEYCLTGHMSLCPSPDTKRRDEEPPRLSQADARSPPDPTRGRLRTGSRACPRTPTTDRSRAASPRSDRLRARCRACTRSPSDLPS